MSESSAHSVYSNDNDSITTKGSRDTQRTLEPVTTGSISDLDLAMEEVIRDYHPRLTTYSPHRISEETGRYYPLIRKYGLNQEHFKTFGNIMLNYKLPIRLTRRLLMILMPRESVPEIFIIKIIGLLSNFNIDRVYVNHLLIWTVSVFELIDSTTTIKKLYSVLFHYLAYKTTRNILCHLLYYLTRKEDVTPFRVRKLYELIESERDTASLIGLLLVYHSFRPEVQVPVNVRLGDIFVFEHPNPQFKDDLTYIQSQRSEDTSEFAKRKPALRLPSAKKVKKIVKSRGLDETQHIGLDVLRVYDNIKELHYSEQLQHVLDDRELQHLLVCDPDEIAVARLGYWIGHKILYLVRWNNSYDKGKMELKELLEKLLDLTRFAKSQLPIITTFLKEYLKAWNGIDFQKIIFELIAYVKPDDFNEIYQTILLPLYKRFYVQDVTWKAKLVLCYTEWLKNWALLDWRGHTRISQRNEIDNITCMFEGLSFHVDYFDTMKKLVDHMGRLCVMGLLAEEDHPLMQHASLTFFELLSSIPLLHDVPEIIMPAANFVYRCFFASNAMAVNRICGIICEYKKAYILNETKTEWLSRHSPEYLEHFNIFTTDICNSLWRNMGFSTDSGSGFALTEEVLEQLTSICEHRRKELKMVLSITHSNALAGFSKRFMKELENKASATIEHKEPVTQAYISKLREQGGIQVSYLEYRIEYLNYLNEQGLTGIVDLLYACMTTLINLKRRSLESNSSSSV